MDDKTLFKQFNALELPKSYWTHNTHLRIGYLYLTHYSFDTALSKLRNGITALNKVHGVKESLDSGYHETITVAWLRLIQHLMTHYPDVIDSQTFIHHFRNPLAKDRLLRFYSEQRLWSSKAKTTFLEPDRTPFLTIIDETVC